MLIRPKLIALPPRLSPPTKGKGRSIAQHVDRRRHEQRRTSVVQERTIEFDIRLSNSLKYTNETTLDYIELLRLFKERSACLVIKNLDETNTSTPEFSHHQKDTSKLVVEGQIQRRRRKINDHIHRAVAKDILLSDSQPRHNQCVDYRVLTRKRNRYFKRLRALKL